MNYGKRKNTCAHNVDECWRHRHSGFLVVDQFDQQYSYKPYCIDNSRESLHNQFTRMVINKGDGRWD